MSPKSIFSRAPLVAAAVFALSASASDKNDDLSTGAVDASAALTDSSTGLGINGTGRNPGGL